MSQNSLEKLEALGVQLIPRGDGLIIRPASRVSPEDKAWLREHKAEVLAVLKTRPTCAASCYEVEPGRRIHHPWDGCQTVSAEFNPSRQVEVTCWHCGGSGRCDCSTCGVMRPAITWVAGECVACKANQSRIVQ